MRQSGYGHLGGGLRRRIAHVGDASVRITQPTLGELRLDCDGHPTLLFTDIDEPGLCTREVYERRGGYVET